MRRPMSVWLCSGALLLLLTGCQSATVGDVGVPPAPPSVEGLSELAEELSAAPAMDLGPNQMVGCYQRITGWYYGYDACMRYDTGFWWFIWPHGHGFSYCYYSVYLSTGRWTVWTATADQTICNQ